MARKKAINTLLAQAFGEIKDGKYTGKLNIPEGPCPTLGGLLKLAKERFHGRKDNSSFWSNMRRESECPHSCKETLLTLVKDLRRQAKIFQ